MPRGGHNAKSIEQKLIDGTFHKNPNRNVESKEIGQRVLQIPEPPKNLNDFGKKAWINLCNDFIVSGLMETVDIFQMEIMIVSLQNYWEYENEISNTTPADIRKMKDDDLNRWRSLTKQSKVEFDKFLKISNNFGLNPVSRRGLITKRIDDTVDAAMELLG